LGAKIRVENKALVRGIVVGVSLVLGIAIDALAGSFYLGIIAPFIGALLTRFERVWVAKVTTTESRLVAPIHCAPGGIVHWA
jgi:F0F1-type ATP synthase assembly protein I